MAQRCSKPTCRSLNFKFLGNIRSILFKGFTFFHYRSSFINPKLINSSVCIQGFNIHHWIFTTINTSIFAYTHVVAMTKAIHHVIRYCRKHTIRAIRFGQTTYRCSQVIFNLNCSFFRNNLQRNT